MILKKLQILLIACLLSISSTGITDEIAESDYPDQVVLKGFIVTSDGVLVSPVRYRKYSVCDEQKSDLQKYIDTHGAQTISDDGFDGMDIVYAVVLAGLAGYVIHDALKEIKMTDHPLHLSMPLP
jgi:hypothetical protein